LIYRHQSVNHAAGDAPYVSLKKRITGTDSGHRLLLGRK